MNQIDVDSEPDPGLEYAIPTEGSYLIGPTSRATLGYERDFTDSTLGNFTIHDKVFMSSLEVILTA